MKVICFDLDDTLYKEIDYLRSAYWEIAAYAVSECTSNTDSADALTMKAYNHMLEIYHKGQNAFDGLNRMLDVNISIDTYLHIYRNHKPNIALSEDVVAMFDALMKQDVRIGLITDGRSVQQRNKIEALGLNRWVRSEDTVISEEFGAEKPCPANYEYFMKRYPECHDFTYVGDNVCKDFIAPNELGWHTVCLKDDGRNIHRQIIPDPEKGKNPQKVITSLGEIV